MWLCTTYLVLHPTLGPRKPTRRRTPSSEKKDLPMVFHVTTPKGCRSFWVVQFSQSIAYIHCTWSPGIKSFDASSGTLP